MDLFFRAFLFTTLEAFVVPLLVAGYLVVHREAFARTTLLLLLSLSINPFLKSLFEVPLQESLGKEGWALPSGHMQTAVVLWGWLAYEVKNRIFTCIVPLLWMGIGAGLIYFGYHTLADVTAAVLSGCLLIAGFRYLIQYTRPTRVQLGALITALSTLFYFVTPNNQIEPYAPSALLGFTLGWALIPQNTCGMPQTWGKKLALLILAFAGIIGLYSGAREIPATLWQTLVLYPAIGLWVGSFAPYLFNYLSSKLWK